MFGYWVRASEKVLPPEIDSAMPSSAFLRFAFFSWRMRVWMARSRGRPAPMSVASWRVKTVRIFVLTFPPPFFRRDFFAGGLGHGRALADPGGEVAELLDLGGGGGLVLGLELADGLLAGGIDGDVGVGGHGDWEGF